jgi:hypothetical protein
MQPNQGQGIITPQRDISLVMKLDLCLDAEERPHLSSDQFEPAMFDTDQLRLAH